MSDQIRLAAHTKRAAGARWVADEFVYRYLALVVAILSAVARARGVPRLPHGQRPDPA